MELILGLFAGLLALLGGATTLWRKEVKKRKYAEEKVEQGEIRRQHAETIAEAEVTSARQGAEEVRKAEDKARSGRRDHFEN